MINLICLWVNWVFNFTKVTQKGSVAILLGLLKKECVVIIMGWREYIDSLQNSEVEETI